MPGEDFLAEARAAAEEDREPPERYDRGGHDGPYGYDLADFDVVPDSLLHFTLLLAGDAQELGRKWSHDAAQNLQEFTTFGAGVPDGDHLQENYVNALQSLYQLMQDVTMGLIALSGAAKYVGMSYFSADLTGAGTIGGAWDDIDVETVGLAFGRQERWPDIQESDPRVDMLEQAEAAFDRIRAGEGTEFEVADGESVQMDTTMGDPAADAAQRSVYGEIADEVSDLNAGSNSFPYIDGQYTMETEDSPNEVLEAQLPPAPVHPEGERP